MDYDFLGKKRDRLSENDTSLREEGNNNIESESKKAKSLNPSLNIKIEGEKKQEEKNSYPNLSEDRRRYLKSLIEKLELSNNNEYADKNITQEEKSRKTFRNGILYALVINS